MSTKVSSVGDCKFRLASGLNRGGVDLEVAFVVYLVGNRLRQGIHHFDLTGEKYEILVAELQVSWNSAVGLFRGKALSNGVDNDSSQTAVVARQVRKVVDAYFERNPSAARDAATKRRHIYFASVFVVEAIYEVQMGHERVLAKFLLSDSQQQVTVEGKYSRRSGESQHEFEIRQLREKLDKQFADNKRQIIEIRDLKSQVEAKEDLRLQLNASKRDEQLAFEKVDAVKAKLAEQRDIYSGRLNAVHSKKDQLERKVGHLEREVKRLEQKATNADAAKNAAEQKVEELKRQLKDQ